MADDFDDLTGPTPQELAQLKKLAARVSDLGPVLTEDGFDTDITMRFDDTSSFSATVHDGAFSFGTTFITDEQGSGTSDSFGHVDMSDLDEAEAELRSIAQQMPQLKLEAAEDDDLDDDE